MKEEKYYSTDLSISIVEIKAESREQAEAVLQRFIDEIGKVMTDEVHWDEADWTIEEKRFEIFEIRRRDQSDARLEETRRSCRDHEPRQDLRLNGTLIEAKD